jgi:AcrR family transcriptional regulator
MFHGGTLGWTAQLGAVRSGGRTARAVRLLNWLSGFWIPVLVAGSGMSQQARAVETRAGILRSAAAVFQRKGYGATSLADVSAASGLTKGALYFHFESKEALALAVIDAQHDRSISLGRALLDQKESGLRAALVMSFQLARQLRDDTVVRAGIRLTMEASSFSAPVREPYLDWMAAFEGYLGSAIADGDVRADIDVVTVAHFIIPAFTGVQLVSEALTGRADIYDRITEMWRLLLPALVPEERWEKLSGLPSRVRREVVGTE